MLANSVWPSKSSDRSFAQTARLILNGLLSSWSSIRCRFVLVDFCEGFYIVQVLLTNRSTATFHFDQLAPRSNSNGSASNGQTMTLTTQLSKPLLLSLKHIPLHLS